MASFRRRIAYQIDFSSYSLNRIRHRSDQIPTGNWDFTGSASSRARPLSWRLSCWGRSIDHLRGEWPPCAHRLGRSSRSFAHPGWSTPAGLPARAAKALVVARLRRGIAPAPRSGWPAASSGNRLEGLRGDRAGQHSIRINDQYRLCFLWSDAGPEAVEIVDYH